MKVIKAVESPRIDFLDSLRTFIVILVVLHHTLLAYGSAASAFWYIADKNTTIVFDGLILINDIFMMPVMFFIAGFFVFPSLRKGAASFLVKKARRILLPLVIGAFVLISPCISYMARLAKGNSSLDFFHYYLTAYLPHEAEPHHLWFLSVLFLFFLISAAVFIIKMKLAHRPAGKKNSGRKPGLIFLIGFGFLTGLAYFGMTMVGDDGYWFGFGGVFAIQVTRSVFYAAYFILGAVACRRRWLENTGSSAQGRLAVCSAAVVSAGTIVFRALAGEHSGIFMKLAYALFHSFTCLVWLLALLSIFRGIRSAGRFPGWAASHSFPVYIVHAVPVIAVQLLLTGWEAPAYLKALIVFAAGLGASLLISLAIRGGRRLISILAGRGNVRP